MRWLDWLLGRRLATLEEEHQQIGPGTGIPVLGLEALASAAYGPEAALTLLIPLGALGVAYSLPILAIICAILVTSQYRQFLSPFVEFIQKLEREYSDRDIAVVIPDLIMCHWYEGVLHNNRGAFMRMILRAQCSDRVVVINTPFHLRD